MRKLDKVSELRVANTTAIVPCLSFRMACTGSVIRSLIWAERELLVKQPSKRSIELRTTIDKMSILEIIAL